MLDILNNKTNEKSSEYDAASEIYEKIKISIPTLKGKKDLFVKIFVECKCHGEQPQDIDIIIIGNLKDRRIDVNPQYLKSSLKFFTCENFVLTVEVKAHSQENIRFQSGVAEVFYQKSGWHNATEQSNGQQRSLKNYFKKNEKIHPNDLWVCNLIYFSNLKEKDLPKRPHNFICEENSFDEIMNIVQASRGKTYQNYKSSDGETFQLISKSQIFKKIEPSALDRKKIDRIAKESIQRSWLEDLGKKHLTFSGRGGTGKTIRLLQLAYKAFENYDKRSLILTWNRALVSDLQRTLSIMGIPSSPYRGGIFVNTIYSFVKDFLGTWDEELNLNFTLKSDNYEKKKKNFLDYLKNEVINTRDIQEKIEKNKDILKWDLVFIDESHDWPQNELDILQNMFNYKKFVIADGVDQFVRSNTKANWIAEIPESERRKIPLEKSLRMKSNLARFNNTLAEEIGLDNWNIDLDENVLGGTIEIYLSDITNDYSIINKIKENLINNGNAPVDSLLCVPPNLSLKKLIPKLLINNNQPFWDGTEDNEKFKIINDINQLRVIQYQSCRGLEGWNVINYNLDELWDIKFEECMNSEKQSDDLLSKEEISKNFAAKWIMIPLTRGIDSFTISLKDKNSYLAKKILKTAEIYKDFVKVIE